MFHAHAVARLRVPVRHESDASRTATPGHRTYRSPVWNGFLFPLILTQSGDKAVLPLTLALFRGRFGIDVPATMAAVVLSTLPMPALFIPARRQLVAGLTVGFSK